LPGSSSNLGQTNGAGQAGRPDKGDWSVGHHPVMRDRSPELLQALVDDEDLEGLLQVVTMDEVADA
jgi:hypothetical protein